MLCRNARLDPLACEVNWQQVASDTVTNLIQNRAENYKIDKDAELLAKPKLGANGFTGERINVAGGRGKTDVPIRDINDAVGGSGTAEDPYLLPEVEASSKSKKGLLNTSPSEGGLSIKAGSASNVKPQAETNNVSTIIKESDIQTPVMSGTMSLLDPDSPYYELNKAQYSASNTTNKSSTLTSSTNWYQLGKASLGLIGNGATIATGYALSAVGYTAIVAPDPTTLTKWGGFAAVTVGTSLASKGVAGFSLNAINFKRSLDGVKNDSNYLVGSALEWVTEKVYGKGTPEVKVAQAVDMGIDLVTNPALGRVRFAVNTNRSMPILLQATSWKAKAISQSPQLYTAADKIGGYSGVASSWYTSWELGKNDFKWW